MSWFRNNNELFENILPHYFSDIYWKEEEGKKRNSIHKSNGCIDTGIEKTNLMVGLIYSSD